MKIWKTVLAGILSVSMGISVPLEANAARYKKFRYTPAFEKISAETAKLGVSYKKVLEKAKEKIENINVKKGKKEKLPKTSISTIGVSLTALSLLGTIVSKKKKR